MNDCRGRGIMLAACGGGNSVRMKRKPEPTPHQTTPHPNSTGEWLAYPGISNLVWFKTQPQERALVLDRHWRETDRCFHLRRIEYKTYTGAKILSQKAIDDGTIKKRFSLPHHPPAVPTISNVPILTNETSEWDLMENKSIQSGRKAVGTAGRRHFGRFAKSADSRKVSSKSENASN